jgi:hypothetical protein
VQRFRDGLVLEAHRLCVSLKSRLESNKRERSFGFRVEDWCEGFLVEGLREEGVEFSFFVCV